MSNIDNNDKLKEVFAGNISKEEKKYLFNLKKQIKIINSIDNYQEKENQIYGNKSDYEKVLFEIDRIMLFISKNKNYEYLKKELYYIYLNANMKKKNKVKDYSDLLKTLIKIEITLNMKVGLFKELEELFEEEFDKYYELVIDNKDINNNTYMKRVER